LSASYETAFLRLLFFFSFSFFFSSLAALSILSTLYASTALALVLLLQAKPHSVQVTIFAVVHLPVVDSFSTDVSSLPGLAVQNGQLGYLRRRVSSPRYETERVLRISISSLPPHIPQICLCSKAHCKQSFLHELIFQIVYP
jgi:hypothetical protein